MWNLPSPWGKSKVTGSAGIRNIKDLSAGGEGWITQKADAELILPDGKVVTGSRNVTETCEEILGLKKGAVHPDCHAGAGRISEDALFPDGGEKSDFPDAVSYGSIPGISGKDEGESRRISKIV